MVLGMEMGFIIRAGFLYFERRKSNHRSANLETGHPGCVRSSILGVENVEILKSRSFGDCNCEKSSLGSRTHSHLDDVGEYALLLAPEADPKGLRQVTLG